MAEVPLRHPCNVKSFCSPAMPAVELKLFACEPSEGLGWVGGLWGGLDMLGPWVVGGPFCMVVHHCAISQQKPSILPLCARCRGTWT